VARSDDSGEFGERRRDAPVGARIDPEFIVPAAHVLHERVAVHDHAGGAIAHESPHRTQPRLEPAVIGLDPVVRVLLGVVEGGWDELIDDGAQRPGPIGDHLGRLAVSTQGRHEEPPSGPGVAPRRDIYVDDLAVLVDGAVDVASPAGDLHVGLVYEPTVADRMSARSGSIGKER
jgi:hypothetical protein